MNQTSEEIRSAREVARHIYELGGPDLRLMPDDELALLLRDGMGNLGEAMHKLCVSTAEASAALKALVPAMKTVAEAGAALMVFGCGMKAGTDRVAADESELGAGLADGSERRKE